MAMAHYLALQYSNFRTATPLAAATHGTFMIRHCLWFLIHPFVCFTQLGLVPSDSGKRQRDRQSPTSPVGHLKLAIKLKSVYFYLFFSTVAGLLTTQGKPPNIHSENTHPPLMKASRPNPNGSLLTMRRRSSHLNHSGGISENVSLRVFQCQHENCLHIESINASKTSDVSIKVPIKGNMVKLICHSNVWNGGIHSDSWNGFIRFNVFFS